MASKPKDKKKDKKGSKGSKTEEKTNADLVNTNPYIADKGTRTSGTSIGKAREINAPRLAATQGVNAATVGDVERVVGPSLGAAERFNASRLDTAGDSAYRQRQLDFANSLSEAAAGRGPSIAGLQLQQGLEASQRAQMSAVAGARGLSPALAQRLAMRQGAALQQQTNIESAKARLAEALEARKQLGDVITQGRAAELGIASQNASLEQQAAQVNAAAANERAVQSGELGLRADLANQQAVQQRNTQQAQLTQDASTQTAQMVNSRELNQANLIQDANKANQGAFNTANAQQLQSNTGIRQQSIQSGGQVAAAGASAAGAIGAAQASAYGNITAEQIRTDGANYRNDTGLAVGLGQNESASGAAYDQSNTGANRGAAGDNADFITGTTTAAIGASRGDGSEGKSLDVASDVRLKKNIVPTSEGELQDFLDTLHAMNFEYRNKKLGEGKVTGVMAQDLEKSKVGDEVVEEKGGRKFIDMKKGLSAALAAQSQMNERLKRLEGRE